MGAAILSDLLTEVLIPVAAVIGIAFSLVQWVLVSRVKLSPEAQSPAAHGGKKNGYNDYLIEEEEGLNDHNVVVKCSEIQTAISEGEMSWLGFWSCRSGSDLVKARFFWGLDLDMVGFMRLIEFCAFIW